MAREKRSVPVVIAGREYRILSDADEDSLQNVAAHVDEAMCTIREKTGAIDSRDIAVLTALNFAREILALKGGRNVAGSEAPPDRLRALIDLAESALRGETTAAAGR
jgi:cell division protein ZapA